MTQMNHVRNLLKPRRRAGDVKEYVPVFCTSTILDYVYATLWRCRGCGRWFSKTPGSHV